MTREAEGVRRDVERMRELSEKGLLSQRQLQEMENRIKETDRESRKFALENQRFVENQKEQEARFKELMDRSVRERVDQDREFKARIQEMLEKYEGQRAEFQRAIRERETGARERLEERREVRPEERPRNEESRSGRLEVVASRPIQSGDTLFVSIEGESQLPTTYRIESNGSIRLPLLGSFRVIGQTPGQVREAIGKRLMDTKLGSPAKVRVELRRERERAPER